MRLNAFVDRVSLSDREKKEKREKGEKEQIQRRIKMVEYKKRKKKKKKYDTLREIKIRKKWTTKRATGRHCWNYGHPMARTSRG